jgi:hypothetical protein
MPGHSGEDQFSIFFLILQDYDIVKKFEIIIIDNASLNNVFYRTIEIYYKDKLNKEWLADDWRIRYINYIINLVVQVFLFINIIDLDEFESYDLENKDGKLTNKKVRKIRFRFLELFNQKYNIVVHIRRSNTRTEYFRTLIKKIILMNNRTK